MQSKVDGIAHDIAKCDRTGDKGVSNGQSRHGVIRQSLWQVCEAAWNNFTTELMAPVIAAGYNM